MSSAFEEKHSLLSDSERSDDGANDDCDVIQLLLDFQEACGNGQLREAQKILREHEGEADWLKKDNDDWHSALTLALANGHLDVVQWLTHTDTGLWALHDLSVVYGEHYRGSFALAAQSGNVKLAKWVWACLQHVLPETKSSEDNTSSNHDSADHDKGDSRGFGWTLQELGQDSDLSDKQRRRHVPGLFFGLSALQVATREDFRDEDALMLAARHGRSDMVKYLLTEFSPRPQQWRVESWPTLLGDASSTLFALAVGSGDVVTARLLLSMWSKYCETVEGTGEVPRYTNRNTHQMRWEWLTQPNDESVTPLLCALKSGRLPMLRLLLDQTDGPWTIEQLATQADRMSQGTMHYVCMSGDTEMFDYVLRAISKINPDALKHRTILLTDPLGYAVKHGHLDLVKHMVEHKERSRTLYSREAVRLRWVNYESGKDEEDNVLGNLFHGAVFSGNVALARYLRARFDDPRDAEKDACASTFPLPGWWSARDNLMRTPLMIAVQQGHVEMARYLMKEAEDKLDMLLARSTVGNNMMHDACGSGNLEICRMVAEYSGFDRQWLRHKQHRDPLGHAVFAGKKLVVQWLLYDLCDGAGEPIFTEADLTQSISSPNPFLDACEGGNLPLVKFMVTLAMEAKYVPPQVSSSQSQQALYAKRVGPWEFANENRFCGLMQGAVEAHTHVCDYLLKDPRLPQWSLATITKLKTANGNTVLHKCCVGRHMHVLKYMTSLPLPVNVMRKWQAITDVDDDDLLQISIYYRCFSLVRWLLQGRLERWSEKDLMIYRGFSQRNMFLRAAQSGNLALLRFIAARVKNNRKFIQAEDDQEMDAMELAIRNCRYMTVRFLHEQMGLKVPDTVSALKCSKYSDPLFLYLWERNSMNRNNPKYKGGKRWDSSNWDSSKEKLVDDVLQAANYTPRKTLLTALGKKVHMLALMHIKHMYPEDAALLLSSVGSSRSTDLTHFDGYKTMARTSPETFSMLLRFRKVATGMRSGADVVKLFESADGTKGMNHRLFHYLMTRVRHLVKAPKHVARLRKAMKRGGRYQLVSSWYHPDSPSNVLRVLLHGGDEDPSEVQYRHPGLISVLIKHWPEKKRGESLLSQALQDNPKLALFVVGIMKHDLPYLQQRDAQGRSALLLAASLGRVDVMRALIDAPCEPFPLVDIHLHVDKRQRNVLHAACSSGVMDAVELVRTIPNSHVLHAKDEDARYPDALLDGKSKKRAYDKMFGKQQNRK